MKLNRFTLVLVFSLILSTFLFMGCESKGSEFFGSYVGDKGNLQLKEGGLARIDVGNKTFEAKWVLNESGNSSIIEITLPNGEVEEYEKFYCKAFSYSVETSIYYLIAPINNEDGSFTFTANSEIDGYNRYFGNYELTFRKDGTFEYHFESQSSWYRGSLNYYPGGIPGLNFFWPRNWDENKYYSGKVLGKYKYNDTNIDLVSDSGESMTIMGVRNALCLYNSKSNTAYLLFNQ